MSQEETGLPSTVQVQPNDKTNITRTASAASGNSKITGEVQRTKEDVEKSDSSVRHQKTPARSTNCSHQRLRNHPKVESSRSEFINPRGLSDKDGPRRLDRNNLIGESSRMDGLVNLLGLGAGDSIKTEGFERSFNTRDGGMSSIAIKSAITRNEESKRTPQMIEDSKRSHAIDDSQRQQKEGLQEIEFSEKLPPASAPSSTPRRPVRTTSDGPDYFQEQNISDERPTDDRADLPEVSDSFPRQGQSGLPRKPEEYSGKPLKTSKSCCTTM